MTLLEVSNLGKSFGGNRAVDDASFSLAEGELLALIGPNGAGKSTLFNMLSGQLSADQGSVRLDGHELLGRSPRAICHMGVGRTFQIAETFASLTVSYGDIKRVELAMAMAHRPRLLLMDEPTAGMAPAERHALMALTRRWVDSHGLSVLFTEHSMDVVFSFADRIVVLAQGKVIANGSPQAVRQDRLVQQVYLGTGSSFEAAPGKEAAT